MNRRNFFVASAAATAGASLATAAPNASRNVIELRYFHMRTNADNQMQRTSEFLRASVAASKRSGATALGFFGSIIADRSPFILSLAAFPSLAALEIARSKESDDKDFKQASDTLNALPGLGYERQESSLIRCFEAMPSVDLPAVVSPGDPQRPPRVFELRMYESNNTSTLSRKVNMFNTGEIGIFQRLGMRPVFFGETIVGARMPNLVYMLSFDNLAAREKLWQAFGADPEWVKLRSLPGNNDTDNVSNITNAMLRPLPFSEIR